MDLTSLRVDEYTSPSLITIRPEEELDRALELMQENEIRHLPVMKQESVLGIISERDILTHIGKDWSRMLKIEDIMSTSLLSVYKNDNLGEVAFQLSTQKKGPALELENDGSLYGIFTTTDALNALVEVFCPNGPSALR